MHAALRSEDRAVALVVEAGLATSYAHCAAVLSPSAAADARLAELGIDRARIARWDRGVDTVRFTPGRRARRDDGRVRVLYAGRLAREKETDLLAG